MYGEWLRDDMERGYVPQPFADPDNAVLLWQARMHSLPLTEENPAIESLLPPIPFSEIRLAIREALPNLLASIKGDERNVLLTLSRMWYTAATRELTSKDNAALWAESRVPEPFATLLAKARNAYLGNVVDDGKLLEECSKNEILTVADAAHGAHFAYSSLLPQAAAGRADVSFCSMHKTMSVYTGGALINLKDDSLYDKAVYYRQLWHTTSPSYLVMASMDHAREVYARRGEEIYGGILAARREFEREAVGKWFSVDKSDDVSRLVISCGGLDAQQANVALAQKGVYAEAAIGDSLIFILSESNVSCLRLLLRTLAECRPPAKAPEIYAPERKRAQATGAVTFVPVSEGAGRVCMNEVGFYPPGTPFVGRGEILTAGDVETIAKNRGCTFGLVNGKLVVLQ